MQASVAKCGEELKGLKTLLGLKENKITQLLETEESCKGALRSSVARFKVSGANLAKAALRRGSRNKVVVSESQDAPGTALLAEIGTQLNLVSKSGITI